MFEVCTLALEYLNRDYFMAYPLGVQDPEGKVWSRPNKSQRKTGKGT